MRLILTDTIDPEFDEKCEATADGSFRILIDENNKLEDYLNNPSIFFKIYDEERDIFKKLNINKKKIFEDIINCEYIELDFNNTDIINYIDNNEYVRNKKIILKGHYSIEEISRIKEDLKKYSKYSDIIYIEFDGNHGYTNIEEAYKTSKQIMEKANNIKSLNLSPMETIMYVYDIVRNRVYTKEDDGESYTVSRDLTSVLNGDKIVCAGYSNIFKSLLSFLGIKCENTIFIRKDGKSAHARNVAYIKDDKYNIDGVYYFDTTWDSKRGESNNFLNKYLYFAKAKIEIDYLSKNYQPDFKYSMDLMKNFINDLSKYLEMDRIDPYLFLTDIRGKYEEINRMSYICGYDNLITKVCGGVLKSKGNLLEEKKWINYGIKEAKNLDEKFKYFIPAEMYIDIINNVRKVEHEIDPELYSYDVECIKTIVKNSRWDFTKNYKSFHNILFGNQNYDELIDHYLVFNNIANCNKNKEYAKVLK